MPSTSPTGRIRASNAAQIDLFDAKATEALAAEIAREHHVTHIVHNAGIIRPNPVEQAKAADIAALAQLHLGAALILLDAGAAADEAAGFGRVVLISSRAALGATGRTAYSATKAGIIGMGRTWALELAPFGITVNMVAPGPIQGTHMFHEIVPAGSDRETALAAAIPMKPARPTGGRGQRRDVLRSAANHRSSPARFSMSAAAPVSAPWSSEGIEHERSHHQAAASRTRNRSNGDATLIGTSRRREKGHLELRLWLRMLSCSVKMESILSQRLRKEFKTSMARFDVLAQLERFPDGLTMSDLSRRLIVSNGAITGLVDKLCRAGLVMRREDPHDRRSMIVRLTRKGRDNFLRMARRHEEWVVSILGDSSGEAQSELLQNLTLLQHNLDLHGKS